MKKQSPIIKVSQNGITLIALVITIIILLILTAVAIGALTGDNGILKNAAKAKEGTEQAEEEELRKFTILEAQTHLEDYLYTDKNNQTVMIPAKCSVSKIEGENALEDGLVIIDVNGNEWVWIEIPESVTAGSTTDDEIESALISYATNYRGSYSDDWYEGCGLEKQEYAQKYSKMLRSIKANKGFYIGRYEVGSFDNPVSSEDITRTAVVQQRAYPYNYVTCKQAEDLAEKLAIKNKTSSLMFGIQWDLVLTYLESKGVPETELNDDSSSWGNYGGNSFSVAEGNKYAIYNQVTNQLGQWNLVPSNYKKPNSGTENWVLLSTGAVKDNSKMNIYDLAGNVYEWTLEKSTNTESPCVDRGGNFTNLGPNNPSSFRYFLSVSDSRYYIGFRPALY